MACKAVNIPCLQSGYVQCRDSLADKAVDILMKPWTIVPSLNSKLSLSLSGEMCFI
jgi:hypothetical protein